MCHQRIDKRNRHNAIMILEIWSVSQSDSLSVCLPSLCASLPSVCPSLTLPFSLCAYLSVCLPVCLSLPPRTSLYLCPSVSPFVPLSLSPSPPS